MIFNFIRHGESESNIGLPTDVPNDIKLTEKGYAQAKNLAASIPHSNLIIHSVFVRAADTAKPLIEKFPNTPVFASNNIHEINYLCPIKNKGTTFEQRRAFREKYISDFDIHRKDGDLAESFYEFMFRVDCGIFEILRLARETQKELTQDFQSHIFSHAFTISAVLFRTFKPIPLENIDNKYGLAFFDFARALRIGNCQNIRLTDWQLKAEI